MQIKEWDRHRWTSAGWKTEAGGAERVWKRQGERKRERRKERVNASYCWNAVATCNRKEGGGVCVCVCAQGQWVLCSVQAAPFQRCVELCWQPSDCGLKLLASLDACLKQSSTAFQNSVSTLWELYWDITAHLNYLHCLEYMPTVVIWIKRLNAACNINMLACSELQYVDVK